MSFIGGFSNEFYRRLFQRIYIGGSSNGFFNRRFVQWVLKTKIFCFENSFFSYMANACMRESVRTRDNGARHCIATGLCPRDRDVLLRQCGATLRPDREGHARVTEKTMLVR